jgi:glycine/D-amino acid oxidase-like deaminating enzyme
VIAVRGGTFVERLQNYCPVAVSDEIGRARIRVAVLGAGLQGACVAMDLAAGGADVDIYDRHPDSMMGASLNNEGKVHLGYVYANDRTLRTAETMVEGAATFGPLLERWLGVSMTRFPISTPFNYAVHRDSLLSADEVEIHLKRTHHAVAERIRGGDYFGVDLDRAPERLSPRELEADYDPEVVPAVFRTPEIGIEPAGLAELVRARIADDPTITSRFETEVLGVRVDGEKLVVDSSTRGFTESSDYDHVVNALWGGRLVVDATMGIFPERPWLFRVKHYLVSGSPEVRIPSTTIVLGPFGDILDYGDGTVYLSWYPSGMQGKSSELAIPESLRSLSPAAEGRIRDGIVSGLSTIVPRVGTLSAELVRGADLRGGLIFAWGESDIDDAESGLHHRHAIGPRSFGRYHSVDTGKLTTAPLYARIVSEWILGMR